MKKNAVVTKCIKTSLLSLTLLTCTGVASAQSLGSVVAAKQNPLPVYANPDAVAPAGTVAAGNLPVEKRFLQSERRRQGCLGRCHGCARRSSISTSLQRDAGGKRYRGKPGRRRQELLSEEKYFQGGE